MSQVIAFPSPEASGLINHELSADLEATRKALRVDYDSHSVIDRPRGHYYEPYILPSGDMVLGEGSVDDFAKTFGAIDGVNHSLLLVTYAGVRDCLNRRRTQNAEYHDQLTGFADKMMLSLPLNKHRHDVHKAEDEVIGLIAAQCASTKATADAARHYGGGTKINPAVHGRLQAKIQSAAVKRDSPSPSMPFTEERRVVMFHFGFGLNGRQKKDLLGLLPPPITK